MMRAKQTCSLRNESMFKNLFERGGRDGEREERNMRRNGGRMREG